MACERFRDESPGLIPGIGPKTVERLAARGITTLGALQDISNRRWLRPPDVLPCFAAAQEKIEEVARRKLAGRSAATGGLMNLFSDDFEEEEAPAE